MAAFPVCGHVVSLEMMLLVVNFLVIVSSFTFDDIAGTCGRWWTADSLGGSNCNAFGDLRSRASFRDCKDDEKD